MNIPKEFQKDIPIFAGGGYSKLSPNLKNRIVEFHGLSKKDGLHQVLFKDEELKKKFEKDWGISMSNIELFQKPNLEDEMLNNQSWMKKYS